MWHNLQPRLPALCGGRLPFMGRGFGEFVLHAGGDGLGTGAKFIGEGAADSGLLAKVVFRVFWRGKKGAFFLIHHVTVMCPPTISLKK